MALVSIPRDTLVNGKYGSHRYYKINSAYSYGGIEELRAVVAACRREARHGRAEGEA